MLRRTQVLLTDWQEEYVKSVAEKYDLSFSEVVRVYVCLSVLFLTTTLHPEYKAGSIIADIAKRIKKRDFYSMTSSDVHAFISKIYFETRKAIEFRVPKDIKNIKKKKKS